MINLKKHIIIEFCNVSSLLLYGFFISLILIYLNIDLKYGTFILIIAYVIELILKIIDLKLNKKYSISDKIYFKLLKIFKTEEYNVVRR